MKKILLLTLPCFFLLSGCGNNASTNLDLKSTVAPAVPTTIPFLAKTTPNPVNKIVALNTIYGQILIKLYSKEAPNTTSNFLNKIKSGFYNNLNFHRVESGFVIQGGDPLGNGTGGGSIKSEINTLPFKRGSVGLARGPNRDISNDSQFFICLSTAGCQPLTNDYVNFGEVISGMEFVNQVRVGDKITNITSDTK